MTNKRLTVIMAITLVFALAAAGCSKTESTVSESANNSTVSSVPDPVPSFTGTWITELYGDELEFKIDNEGFELSMSNHQTPVTPILKGTYAKNANDAVMTVTHLYGSSFGLPFDRWLSKSDMQTDPQISPLASVFLPEEMLDLLYPENARTILHNGNTLASTILYGEELLFTKKE